MKKLSTERLAVKAAYMKKYRATRDEAVIYMLRYNMVRRCTDPKNKEYHMYGGRGITVCDLWMQSADLFIKWALLEGWKRGLQIDRIDNDGNYTPENCRFVTRKDNCRNRRNNKLDVQKVAEIRHMLNEGFTGRAIARKFSVDSSLIYRIKQNKQWV